MNEFSNDAGQDPSAIEAAGAGSFLAVGAVALLSCVAQVLWMIGEVLPW